MKIIVDFDNAFGVKKRDVDDFIAFLYLIKAKEDIVLVTTTFGNASIEEVNEATKMIFKDLELDYELAFGDEDAGEKIVEKVNKNPGNITILTLGSTTNVNKALQIDESIKDKAKLLSMGTITEELLINEKIMDELNFSVDHQSSSNILEEFNDITILTANNCLDGYFTLEEIDEIFKNEEYLMEKAKDWFDFHSEDYDIGYIIIWDLITAAYITKPEIFQDDKRKMTFSNPEKGLLTEDEKGRPINMPKVKDRKALVDHIRQVFHN